MSEPLRRTKRSLASEATFRRRLRELGAELLEPEYLGGKVSHRVRCAAGHECSPKPSDAAKAGICRVCAGNDPAAAAAAFRTRLAELGAELLEPSWLGNRAKHLVRCSAGHECYPRPFDVRGGHNPCRTCTGHDPAVAFAAFQRRLTELGAELLETEWLGALRPHRVRCSEGHGSSPLPNSLQQGQGICGICARNDREATGEAYAARLAQYGAVLVEPYAGASARVSVRCADGHVTKPLPTYVLRGGGPCLACAGLQYDVFYVVGHEREPVVKFGITARKGVTRLATHRMNGFTIVHLLLTGLPDGVARQAEDAARAALALARAKPVRGREYFDRSHLALILDVAAGWLAAPEVPARLPVRWVQDELFAVA